MTSAQPPLTPEQIEAIAQREPELLVVAMDAGMPVSEWRVLLTVAERDALVAAARPKTCETCRHWTDEQERRCPAGFRSCASPDVSRTYPGREAYPATSAIVECDEGWGIFTGPDFGCTLWTPRED